MTHRLSPLLAIAATALAAALPAQTQDELVARLAAAPAYDDEIVGDEPSPTFADFRRLLAQATVKDLVALAGHDAPVVRCYAVRGLADLGATKELPALLRAHAEDTAKVAVRSGCERYTTNAGDLMFDHARPKLAGEQVLDLAEFLVRNDSPLYAREWALRNVRFRDGMRERLRERARGGDRPSLIALMRYKVPADVEVLLDAIEQIAPDSAFDDNCAFLAAEISKDARLLPPLAGLQPAARARLRRDIPERLRFWLQALAAQRSDAAAAALREFVASDPVADPDKREQLQKTVLAAIEQHPAPAFDDLRTALGGSGR